MKPAPFTLGEDAPQLSVSFEVRVSWWARLCLRLGPALINLAVRRGVRCRPL